MSPKTPVQTNPPLRITVHDKRRVTESEIGLIAYWRASCRRAAERAAKCQHEQRSAVIFTDGQRGETCDECGHITYREPVERQGELW